MILLEGRKGLMEENWIQICMHGLLSSGLPSEIIMMVVMMLHDACCGGDAGFTCIDVHLASSTRESTLHYHS